MDQKDDHYFNEFLNSRVRFHTVSVTLRRHLYLFKTTTGIFSYKKLDLGTRILIENMNIPKSESTLLDLGCGYGAIGIVLGYESPKSKIYLTDPNRRALWCTKQNIQINLPQDKSRVRVLYGKNFEPFYSKNIMFDGIYMNPPMRLGREHFFKLLEELPNYLKKKGTFQFVIRKKMGAEYVYKYLMDNFTNQQTVIIRKRSGYWVFNYLQD